MIVCSIRDYKMCLPNTYIMYEQTANTAFNAHTRMLRIEQFQFECGTLFKFTAINHGTDGFFFSVVFFCVCMPEMFVHSVCWSHLCHHILGNVYVYFGVLCCIFTKYYDKWNKKEMLYAITWNLNECRCAISITIATFGDHFDVLMQWKHALSALY